jgi:ribosomal protein L24
MVIVEGVNMHKRHQRASRMGGKGQIIEKAMPVHASNVRAVK